MKQFLNVLKFELGNYFKSRSFMVTTVLLALVVAAAVALPPVFMKGSFSDVFGGGKESSKETAESSSGPICREEKRRGPWTRSFTRASTWIRLIISNMCWMAAMPIPMIRL